ncbi:HAD family acid phosphatase [Bradyrhizobium sp. S3.2.12]|uniref:HAD family acid phosphatase n=1 Tax=Bradyrhizobium sp. S3.2.12 TaxID=3156387 RepID=UPI0033914D20
MSDDADRQVAARLVNGLRRRLAGMLLIALLTAAASATIRAAECSVTQLEPRIPAPSEVFSTEKSANIDTLKSQLKEYKEGKDGKPSNYEDDVKQVFDRALAYVRQRVDEAKRSTDQDKALAVVLDIDETSLSNWPNLKANNFGFIKGGPCLEEPTLSCGFDEWILKASAPAIPQALEFYRAVIDTRSVAVFFITGRRHSQRQATLLNLDAAGFRGFAGLRTRPDDQHADTIVPFKSGERKAIEEPNGNGKQYKIIASIGDQESDLEGGFAECRFKVPNPFYFIR